ncbi:MAG: acetate--CoA ligase family protein [Candidatus Caenarcaniphilales bacterium]|nr:acetate--CoA ligase family protein [Candidatus Caenarcaniphilales bacterium]
MDSRIDKIFNPSSVAIVGASERQETVGYAVLNNLLTMGFEGKVYPINPKRDSILGHPAYPSLSSVKGQIDLAVIATPAQTVPGIIHECGKLGIQSVIIISSGFAEIGEEGTKLQAEIEQLRQEYKMRIIGPNCLGVINPWINLNASFAGKMPSYGKVGFISQSGALCTSILDWAIANNVGFSNFVSIGSMMDIEFADLIDYFNDDEKTESIILYIESIKKPEEFIEAARRFTARRPIFAIKSGRFEEGSKAAASHTGALAGSDDVYEAALEKAGIIRVKRVKDLINVAQSLSMQDIPKGDRLCILTNAGGPGVIATDAVIERGGKLAELSDKTMEALNQSLPSFWSHGNPVDVLGDARADRYEKAIDICIQDENTDALMIIFTPQAMSEPVQTSRAVSRIAKKHSKPIFTSWMGADYVEEGVKMLLKYGIPSYQTPEQAIDAFSFMHKYRRLQDVLAKIDAEPVDKSIKVDEKVIKSFKDLINKVKASGERNFLNEVETKDLLEEYGIPTTRTKLATNSTEAAQLAKEIGFPVVLKIQSPQILHKTDAGGVLLNLNSEEEVSVGFEKIVKNAKAYDSKSSIEGVTVQKMVTLKNPHELIVGLKKDPVWGPAIIFGSGGVNVELLQDKTITLLPLNRFSAQRAIESTRIYKLLQGYRGQEGANLEKLKTILVNFSQLVADFPEINEIDINPLSILGDEAYALDARVIV